MTKRRKLALVTLLAIGVAALIWCIPIFLKLVESLGYRIPQKNIQLDYIIGFLWAVFLGLTILIWPVRATDKKALIWIWAVKCFVMLFLMLFYEYHYQIDSFSYFTGARRDMKLWEDMGVGGTSSPVFFIIWLHQHLFLNSYHAVKVTFGMIGLAAIYIFYRAAVSFLQRENMRVLFIFAFFPSILFWSSTLGKDPIILLGMALYCYGVIKQAKGSSLWTVIALFLGIFIASEVRPWLVYILILPVIAVIVPVLSKKSFIIKATIIMALVLMPFLYINKVAAVFNMKPGTNLITVANSKYNGYTRGNSVTGADKLVAEPGTLRNENRVRFSNVKDMAIFIPSGAFTALFRPLPGEVNNIFGLMAGIEDLSLLILFVIAIKRMKRRELQDSLIVWAILLVAIWAAAYGFVSYNLGTVCRQRLQILPVFLGLLLYFSLGKKRSTSNSNELTAYL